MSHERSSWANEIGDGFFFGGGRGRVTFGWSTEADKECLEMAQRRVVKIRLVC